MNSHFWSLSLALTGNASLDSNVAEALLAGISYERETQINMLLATWANKPVETDPQRWIADSLWSDVELKRLCQDIILSWMFGQCFRDGKAQSTPTVAGDDQAKLWFSGSFWGLAKAHVPGLPGGYFGHWSYPGEG